jgi:hypothetical protein
MTSLIPEKRDLLLHYRDSHGIVPESISISSPARLTKKLIANDCNPNTRIVVAIVEIAKEIITRKASKTKW